MDHIKKIGCKMFKKGAKQRRDPKLRYSRSMPLRNSDDTQESYRRPRPIFRGDKPLQVSDIHPFVDISADAIAAQGNPHHGWPRYQDTDEEDDYYDLEGEKKHAYVPFIDRKIVDKFPSPPTTTTRSGNQTPHRPCLRPPTMNMDELDFPDALLPPIAPEMKAKMAAIQAQGAEERRRETAIQAKFQEGFQARQRASEMKRTPQRSNSSASSYIRGATNYPPALGAYLNRGDGYGTTAPLSIPAKSGGVYANKSHNLSTHSLGPNAHFRAGPVTATPNIVNQPTGARCRKDSTSSMKPSIYANSAHNTSTHSLGANTLFRTQRVPVIRQGSSQPTVDPVTGIRGRNGSSASTKSSLYRNGAVYQADAIRVARGPHAAKLHSANPGEGRFDPDLQVNDSDSSGEWGSSSKKKAKASTVAGQGRGGFRR